MDRNGNGNYPPHSGSHSPYLPGSGDEKSEEPPSGHQNGPVQDGRSDHHNSQIKTDQEVPIDPSISAPSPSYPNHPVTYAPYVPPPPPPQPPHHEIPQSYQNHANGSMYNQPRPDWAGYAGHQGHPPHSSHSIPGAYTVSGGPSSSAAAPVNHRPGPAQIYSFVPIPGAQQHKRPRRRYEEIERMHKCGYNGCEKAYGTLNHLNAHVTMQSHGNKRTPDEFKEIRKEWKARKKEEENQRKAEEDRNRAAAQSEPQIDVPPSSYAQVTRAVQLPPIGYQTAPQVPNPYQPTSSPGVQHLHQEYQQPQITYSGYPSSPYGNAPPQMFPQSSNTPSPPRSVWQQNEMSRFIDNNSSNGNNGNNAGSNSSNGGNGNVNGNGNGNNPSAGPNQQSKYEHR